MYFGLALASAVVSNCDVITSCALTVRSHSFDVTYAVLSDVIASFCSFPLVTSRARNSLELVASLLGNKLEIVEKLMEEKQSALRSRRSLVR